MDSCGLTELLRGKGAHADPMACVEDLSAGLAAKHMAGFPHSVGQLVFHMNYWMDYELRRIRGERPSYPEHNSKSFPPSPSPVDEKEWELLKRTFAVLLGELDALARSSPEELQRQVEATNDGDGKVSGTLENVLSQLVAHNSYHTGQIAAIRRVLGAWPPRGGGDTW
ncbi:MAG TPA: DinB family protein [Candidatus Aquilonibacter sp.]|nr:DinB family protein [Candidatus Aquilonibacter sp.]